MCEGLELGIDNKQNSYVSTRSVSHYLFKTNILFLLLLHHSFIQLYCQFNT